MLTHAAVLTEIYEFLEAEYGKTDDAEDKKFLRTLGQGMTDAVMTTAVYSIKRDIFYLHEHRTRERWADFRAKLKENTQAVFNHGDPGPEDSIIALVSSTQAADGNDPEIVNDTLFLWFRVEGKIYGVAASINRGHDRIRFWPMIIIDAVEATSNLTRWLLSNEEDTDANLADYGLFYLAVLSYLDEQIAADATTGHYGDGMTYISMQRTDFLIGPPEWLRAG
jgi:hypothetical protein